MSRAKWKGSFIGLYSRDNFKINRNLKVVPKLFGLTVKVHNGKSYKELIVTEDMLGCKFGEFSFTRCKFSFKKKSKKSKK